jgi:hypothetical protein
MVITIVFLGYGGFIAPKKQQTNNRYTRTRGRLE